MSRATRITIYAFVGVTLSTAVAAVAWYRTPVRIEEMDRMLYCACGYSEVKFTRGKIVMIHYHHDTVKPGEQIGSYSIAGNDVDIEISFDGKTHHEKMHLDHVGLLAPPLTGRKYQAYSSVSWKMKAYYLLDNIGIK